MEKEFVPYKLALRMKALGFDEPCFGSWWFNPSIHKLNEEELQIIKSYYFGLPEYCILAPTFSQAFRWFREKYFYLSYVCSPYEYNDYFFILRHIGDVINEGELENFESQVYKSYEESELACLTKLIEIVEHKSE